MTHDEIETLRKSVVARLLEQFHPMPLTVDHYRLAEEMLFTELSFLAAAKKKDAVSSLRNEALELKGERTKPNHER